jgi:hypothetical protein
VGLYIALQKESSVVVEGVADDKNVLHKLLPRNDGSLLSGIDWYGDTTFNGLQMKQFLAEWDELQKIAAADDAVLLGAIQELASRCQSGTHLYLKFVGD